MMRSSLIPNVWLCFCIALLLSSEIYCGELAPCVEVILLDAEQPIAEITFKDKHYHHRRTDDIDVDGSATAECLWYFRSPPGTTIQLDIVTLEPQTNPIILYDGPGVTTDDQAVTLDGSHASSFKSTGRGLTCKLPTQSPDVNREPSLTLQATLQGEVSIEAANPGECGGTIHLDQNSPVSYFNVANNYPSGGAAYCNWYINSPFDTKIIIEFFDWQELDDNDYLRIYDSRGKTIWHIRGEFDQTLEPVVLDSCGRLLFDASYSVSDTHFGVKVSYTDELIHNSDGVQRSSGGVIELNNSTTSLTIQSLNITSNYMDVSYMYNYWYVTGPVGRRLKVQFHQLNEGSFTVYDSSISSRPVSQFSVPSVIPEDRVFSQNSATLLLYLSGNYFNEGVTVFFTISITDEYPVVGPDTCGGTIELDTYQEFFVFNSPYYYNQQPPSGYTDCWWYVSSPAGKRVQLHWLDIDTGSEYVYVYDHPSSSTVYELISRYRGDLDIDLSPFVSSRGVITILLDDYSSAAAGKGFLANVSISDGTSVVGPTSCGGTVVLDNLMPNFTLNSPLYYHQPSFNAYVLCYWNVLSDVAEEVQLTWRDIHTNFAYPIELFDYPSYTHSYLVSAIRGDVDVDISPVVSSRGGWHLRFADQYPNDYRGGFLAEFSLRDTAYYSGPASCGGTIPLTQASPSTTISSPYYYQHSTSSVMMDCYWYITSPSGTQVQLTVGDLDTRDDERILVNDSPNSIYRIVSELSGRLESPATILSSRGGLTLLYDDGNINYNGPGMLFEAKIIDTIPSNITGFCGGVIPLSTSTPSVTTTTPLFYEPSTADVNIDCWWYVTSPSGKQVEMSIHDIETDQESVRVHDNPSSTSSLYRISEFRGQHVSDSTLVSSRGGFSLWFDDLSMDKNGCGFAMDVALTGEPVWDQDVPLSSCGSTIKLTSQYNNIKLTTPDYPLVNGSYYQCTWFVECPSQSRMQIGFNDFWLDPNGYLRVFDGPTTSDTIILHATGQSIPSNVLSSSHFMTAYYFNNLGTSGKGASFEMSCVFEDETSEPHVDCDSTSMTVFLDRGLLSDGTVAEDVHLVNEDCVGIDHDSTQIVLYTRYDMCFTSLEETETSIIYSNMVTYYTPQAVNGTVITRENTLKIPVQCILDRHQLLTDFFVPKTGEMIFNETGYGEFSLRLDRYIDTTFDQLVGDDEGVVMLGEHLYFAVNLTSVTGLTVFMENCWATPFTNPNGAKTYNFLHNGCPVDPTMQMIYSSDPSFSPFVIDAFTFIDENPQVFIHCEVLVCNHDDPSSRCAQGCQTRFRRGSSHTRGTSSTPHLISNGPLSSFQTMHSADTHSLGGSPVSSESGILIGALAGVTCLLVALVAILLYMMPSRRVSEHGYRRVDINEDDE